MTLGSHTVSPADRFGGSSWLSQKSSLSEGEIRYSSHHGSHAGSRTGRQAITSIQQGDFLI